MTVLVALLAVFLSQAHLLARGWWGTLAPDPLIVLATLAALALPRRQLLLVAVLLGWVRALTLVEAAGGQVLCVWAALAVVASLRKGLTTSGRSGVLLAGGLAALSWWACAGLIGAAVGVPVSAGRELLLGVPLALPFAGLVTRRPA